MTSTSNDEVCIFFGVSGAGKSSTINTLCGEDKCSIGEGETSETQNCKLVQVHRLNSVFNGKHVLDMQGFNDSRVGQNPTKIFERAKLYFLLSKIVHVKCAIFVISMMDARTDFYEKFADFLGQLFTKENVQKNSLILLTKGDVLPAKFKEDKMKNIQTNILAHNKRSNWNMKVIEWSNETPLPNQEQNLLAAISQYNGFNFRHSLKQIEKEINDQALILYKAEENMFIVKHDAKYELQDCTETHEVDDYITLQCDEPIKKEIPAEMKTVLREEKRKVHFKGQIYQDGFGGVLDSVMARLPTNGLFQKVFCERRRQTQNKEVIFNDPVSSVYVDRSGGGSSLLDSIEAKIDSNDRRKVTIEANFSWSGSVIQSWDFYVDAIADAERTIIVKPKTEEIIILSRQKIEKVRKSVVVPNKKLVEVEQAREEIIPMRTLEQIRQQILNQRILDI